MNPLTLKITLFSALLLLVILTGIWLTMSGIPYHSGISAVHKILSLLAGVALVITVLHMQKIVPFRVMDIAILVSVAVLFLGAFASGAARVALKSTPFALILAHRVSSFASVLGVIVAFFMAYAGKK